MTPEAVLAIVQEAVAIVLEVRPESVLAELALEGDLAADSLAIVEIVDIVESEVAKHKPGFQFADEDLDGLTTVQSTVDYVMARV